jgi:hypothetical protein
METRDTEVRYPGPLDAVEVQVPEDAREFGDPTNEIVKAGGTLKTTGKQAHQLVSQGWELVKHAKEKGGDDK